jgi:hypothetical protein
MAPARASLKTVAARAKDKARNRAPKTHHQNGRVWVGVGVEDKVSLGRPPSRLLTSRRDGIDVAIPSLEV